VRPWIAGGGRALLGVLLAVTKADEAEPGALERLARAFPELELVPVSVLDDESLGGLREAI
jgi:hypothetical protein